MSELLNQLQGRWAFGLGLAVGFPLLLVALNELEFTLHRAGHPVAGSFRWVRTWVLPLAALTLFLRWVLLLPPTTLMVRLLETLCWATVIVAVMGAVNNLVFESARPGTWQHKVPRLLRDLLRLALVAIGLALVYAFVWGREIGGAIATLGVTSIVVGLALQEPLGNLFSGLVLLMERPFEVGETIEVGSVSGTVKEVNWRSAHIETLGGAIQVVPNSKLNKETIVNFSRPNPRRMESIEVGFSYQDPPNKVRQALLDLLMKADGVLISPKPIVATLGYEAYSVRYRLIYSTSEADRWPVKNDLVTRIWYMAQRHRFTMPCALHQEENLFNAAQF
jgi:small-conductance mechanosensitive channel